jgi:hypothetical protein
MHFSQRRPNDLLEVFTNVLTSARIGPSRTQQRSMPPMMPPPISRSTLSTMRSR